MSREDKKQTVILLKTNSLSSKNEQWFLEKRAVVLEKISGQFLKTSSYF